MSVKDEIENLADNVAKQARGKEVRLMDKVEALKALTSYYGMLSKTNKPADEEGAVSFSEFRKRIGA